MAISGLGYVTGSGGKPLEQSPSATEQTVLLSQPGIVELQGSRSQVVAYQQQGEDLILQLAEGQTLRYQHFFSVVDGKQSELVFVGDDNLRERVQFSETLQTDPQAVTAIAPLNSADAGDVAVSEAGSGASSAVGLALGMLGVVGGGVALASRGGGSSDDKAANANPAVTENEGAAAGQAASDSVPAAVGGEGVTPESTLLIATPVSEESVLPITAPVSEESPPPVTVPLSGEGSSAAVAQPTLAVNTISGDDMLNMREAIYGLEIFGTSSHLAAGTEVTLTLDGKTFTGAVWDAAGNWQIFLDDVALDSIVDGQHTLNFSALDENGNGATASRDVWMITHQSSEPQFTVNEVTQADVSTQDGINYVTLSGTLSADFPVTAASVNPGDYPVYDFTVCESGAWSVTIMQSDLSITDGYNSMIFTVADIAGNSYEGLQGVEVHIDPALFNNLMLAEGETALDLALLGLNADQLTTEEALSDRGEAKTNASWAESSSESLTTAEGKTITLSSVDGGVWNDASLRVAAGQPEDIYAYGNAAHENTLADLLAQHNLQVQTT
ncbi:BapA prefix-like domain-containing protein [Erwinia sp. P6884]|uniref:BapA/Bap/LapF family prefix-like domain-containing protein n=1 Tax=Erwinia sp. P6884 TaxID=3141450 RepID=UPI00318DB28D